MNEMKRKLKNRAALSLLVLGMSAVLTLPASAAPKKPPELKKVTYKYLQKAQEQMAEDDWASAKKSLDYVLEKVRKSKYDKAAINQLLGVVYANQEKYDKALVYFKAALADDALYLTAAQQVRYNVAQLSIMGGDYAYGIKALKQWMNNLEDGVEVPARAWILLANGYSRQQQWDKVIEPTRNAIAATEKPREAWYTLLLAAHYELKQYSKAVDVLEILVTMAPQKKQYWLQLSGMNMSLKRDAAALSALRAAHQHGLFDKEGDYTRLANFLTFRQVPFQAGVIYQEGLDKGIIEKNFANYKKLANYWSHAKETDKAILAFYDALVLNKDAALQVKLGRMLAQAERFDELVKLADDPAANMKEKHSGEMLFLSAMAHYQLGDSKKSLQLMRQAADIKSSRGKANSWIGFLEENLKVH